MYWQAEFHGGHHEAHAFVSVSASIAVLVAATGIFLAALAGMRAFNSVATYYEAQTEIAREQQSSKEDLASLATETFGFACAKVLAKFNIISAEDEKQIVSSATNRIEGRSATTRALVEAVERRSTDDASIRR